MADGLPLDTNVPGEPAEPVTDPTPRNVVQAGPPVPGPADLPITVDLATEHKLQFWDALILNVAADAGCSLLLSEDMQDGFAWRGVTVVNPFAAKMHKRLARILE